MLQVIEEVTKLKFKLSTILQVIEQFTELLSLKECLMNKFIQVVVKWLQEVQFKIVMKVIELLSLNSQLNMKIMVIILFNQQINRKLDSLNKFREVIIQLQLGLKSNMKIRVIKLQ